MEVEEGRSANWSGPPSMSRSHPRKAGVRRVSDTGRNVAFAVDVDTLISGLRAAGVPDGVFTEGAAQRGSPRSRSLASISFHPLGEGRRVRRTVYFTL